MTIYTDYETVLLTFHTAATFSAIKLVTTALPSKLNHLPATVTNFICVPVNDLTLSNHSQLDMQQLLTSSRLAITLEEVSLCAKDEGHPYLLTALFGKSNHF